MSAAVVIENGSWTIKAGLAGDDAPRATIPTIVGKQKEAPLEVGQKVKDKYGTISSHWTFANNTVSAWGDMTELWKHTYECLKIDPASTNVLTTVSLSTPKPEREQMMEVFFESLNVPGCYIAYDTVLALYACGRLTGTIVDCGHAGTNVVPIADGFAIHENAIRMPVGGSALNTYLETLVGDPEKSRMNIFNLSAMKESVCRAALNYEEEIKSVSASKHKLPDGKEVEIKPEAMLSPEIYFTPKLRDQNSLEIGLAKLIDQQIKKSAIDLRAQLYSNIILAGGSSIIPGFPERLTKEMKALLEPSRVPRVIANTNREIYSFIGGTVLTSLDAMAQQWVTKAQYTEAGPSIVNTKCA